MTLISSILSFLTPATIDNFVDFLNFFPYDHHLEYYTVLYAKKAALQ